MVLHSPKGLLQGNTGLATLGGGGGEGESKRLGGGGAGREALQL